MTITITPATAPADTDAAPTVALDPVGHGLTDRAGGSRDLDAMLDEARAAEAAGAVAVVVPAAGAGAPGPRQWPATAQALAVLLATDRIRVIVPVIAQEWDVAAVARFAGGATRLAGDRLVVRVLGAGGDEFARRLRADWAGAIVVE